jgi:hypothetical protein
MFLFCLKGVFLFLAVFFLHELFYSSLFSNVEDLPFMSPFSENKCKLLNPELGRRCRSIMSSRLA